MSTKINKSRFYKKVYYHWRSGDGITPTVKWVSIKENRIYIRGEFTRKKCKTAILLYCFHTAGVPYIFMLYNLLGPGISFYRKSKINVKRKPNYEFGWFHNWPLIISLYKRWFSVITINQMMVFIHLIHYKVYLTASKFRNWNE